MFGHLRYAEDMSVAFQGSLLDTVDEVGLRTLGPAIRRTPLTGGAWIDLRPGWLTGADREVEVPRLLSFYDEDDELPDLVLTQARSALTAQYARELGEPFRTAGLCFYRDGRDSVAWHGDTIGRGSTEDTMVAIISVGAPRALLLRRRGGGAGRTIRHVLGHGDLLVMGGSCQRTWEHAIPKTAKPVGPRISIQFRPRGVR